MTTGRPRSSAAVAIRKATVTRSASSCPVARLMTTLPCPSLIFRDPFLTYKVGDRSPTIMLEGMRVNAQTQSDTRQRLLDAAAEAFAERGYHETRIDAVSEAAGVAKGTI